MIFHLASRTHFWLALLWLVLILPTALWLRDSILWVAFLSIYANFVSHWGAYEAARAKETAEEK